MACGDITSAFDLEAWPLDFHDDAADVSDHECRGALLEPLCRLAGVLVDDPPPAAALTRALAALLARLVAKGAVTRVLTAVDGDAAVLELLLEAAAPTLQRYLEFAAAVRQLRGGVPSYAVPVDLTIAGAHLLDVVTAGFRLAAAGPLNAALQRAEHLLKVLPELAASSPPTPAQQPGECHGSGAAFVLAARALQRRAVEACALAAAACGCSGPAGELPLSRLAAAARRGREQLSAEGRDDGGAAPALNLGRRVLLEFPDDGLLGFGRIVLLDTGRVLVQTEDSGSLLVLPTGSLAPAQAHDGDLAEHLAVLGLSAAAGADEVKSAFQRLAKQCHPDKGGDAATFQRIRAAFEALTCAISGPRRARGDDAPLVARSVRAAAGAGIAASRNTKASPSEQHVTAVSPPASAASMSERRRLRGKSSPTSACQQLPAKAPGAQRCLDLESPLPLMNWSPQLQREELKQALLSLPPQPKQQLPQRKIAQRRLPEKRRLEGAAEKPVGRASRCRTGTVATPPHAKRGRCDAATPVLKCKRREHAKHGDEEIPPHELSVNGIMQLIWAFAF